jgi:ethanolamine utilization protein EutN
MRLGKVVGNIVATRKDPRLVGNKLLIVQPFRIQGDGLVLSEHEMLVAIDTVDAGEQDGGPVDAAIVGIVDSIELVKPGSR